MRDKIRMVIYMPVFRYRMTVCGRLVAIVMLTKYGWVSGEKTGSYVEDFKASVADGKFTAYKTCPVPAVSFLLQLNTRHRSNFAVYFSVKLLSLQQL